MSESGKLLRVPGLYRLGLVCGLLVISVGNMAIAAPEFSAILAVRARAGGPRISVSAVPTRVSPGGIVQFVVRTSSVNPFSDLIVSYSMSGTAIPGQDYSS